MTHLYLVLGGMRSGKSRHAQHLAHAAEANGGRIIVLATALAGDVEMQARIDRHRAERPARWVTVETSNIAGALRSLAAEDTVIIIDCLTVWISQMIAPPPGHAAQDDDSAVEELLQALDETPGCVIVVSNEIGMGVIPPDAVTRRVVDALGRAHQRLADRAEHVTWMVAGMPVSVKSVKR